MNRLNMALLFILGITILGWLDLQYTQYKYNKKIEQAIIKPAQPTNP